MMYIRRKVTNKLIKTLHLYPKKYGLKLKILLR